PGPGAPPRDLHRRLMTLLARWPWPIASLTVAAAYLAVGLACGTIAMPVAQAAKIWPPSAVAVFAVLYGGPRLIPGVVAGVLALVLVGAPGEPPLLGTAGIGLLLGAAYGVQAWLGAALV